MDALPTVDSWVVGGDFDHVESIVDVRANVLPILSSIAAVEEMLGIPYYSPWLSLMLGTFLPLPII